MRKIPVLVALTLGTIFAFPARGHNLPISEMNIVADEEEMHVELVVNSSELHLIAELDHNGNGQLEYSELHAEGERIARRILSLLTFRIGDRPLEVDVCGILPNPNTHHLTVRAHYRADARYDALSVQSRLFSLAANAHVTQVTFRRPGKRHVGRLSATDPTVHFPSHPPADH